MEIYHLSDVCTHVVVILTLSYCLSVKGIPAVFLGSAQAESAAVLGKIMRYSTQKQPLCIVTGSRGVPLHCVSSLHARGEYRVVYLTPEYVAHSLQLLQDIDQQVGEVLPAKLHVHAHVHGVLWV